MEKIRVTVWNEYLSEKRLPEVAKIYPQGIHTTIAEFLRKQSNFKVQTATRDEPEHGLTEEVLNSTDVLVYWGHMAPISDAVADRIYRHVTEDGMGLILLHSGVWTTFVRALLGTTLKCLRWRCPKDGEKERLWVVARSHPIVEGIGEYFELEHEEVHGEPFDIPSPDELVFISWFQGGEIIRSGCCFYRGLGKIFYFRPGHETFQSFYDPNVQRVICNSIRWASPVKRTFDYQRWKKDNNAPTEPLEKIY